MESPSNCHLVLLENCLLNCKMCHMWKCDKDPEEIPVPVWKDFLLSLKDFAKEGTQVQFVGGEPLMKKGIIDLIQTATQLKFRSAMTTNGFLIDKEKTQGIAKSGLGTLIISLDSLDEEIHDYLRGVKGVYRKVMQAIDYFREIASEEPRIHIATTIMAANINGLAEIVKWVDKHERIANISFQAVMQPFSTPTEISWHRNKSFDFLWPKDAREINLAIDELKEMKRNGSKITNPIAQFDIFKSYFLYPESFIKKGACNLGRDSFTVNSSGEVFLCMDMEPIGDIRKEQIRDIWGSDKAKRGRQDIKACRNNCKLVVNCFFEEEK